MVYLEHAEVPKSIRIVNGAKHVFFTNHDYDEVIIPELKGINTMPLKTYEKKFAYNTGHITSGLIRKCRDWKVPAEEVVGLTTYEGDQSVVTLYTYRGMVKIKTLLRGGILFLNGDYFNRAYFICPTEESFHEALTWLTRMGKQLQFYTDY